PEDWNDWTTEDKDAFIDDFKDFFIVEKDDFNEDDITDTKIRLGDDSWSALIIGTVEDEEIINLYDEDSIWDIVEVGYYQTQDDYSSFVDIA
ncbi:MAG: hypothetical protein IBX53_10760, partial [Halomonas sp.]|uniref:hypothetical protein n=1 Tax=Halomonas sp. TaxID=1486246 RepID=UPI0019F0FAE6